MKINNKPMSALPSVADTPADTGRSCVRLFGLYTILPKVLRVVVEVLFPYRLITGFYHLEPFLRFGKHVRETVSFQQKGPPLTEWPSIIVELRGFEPLTSTLPVWRAPNCANAPWVSDLQKNYSTHYGKWNKKFGKIAFSFYRKFSIIIINYGLTSGKLVRDVTGR